MPTPSQAVDEITKFFNDVWEPRVVIYENIKGSKPPNEAVEWARFIVRHLLGVQSSLSGYSGRVKRNENGFAVDRDTGNPIDADGDIFDQDGKILDSEGNPTKGIPIPLVDAAGRPILNERRFRHGGLVTVQIFIPLGEGLGKGYDLAKDVLNVYEGHSTPSGVWFRNPRIREIGASGEWYQFNALVDFTYDEINPQGVPAN